MDIEGLRSRIAALSMAAGAGRVTFENAAPSPVSLRCSKADAREGRRLAASFRNIPDDRVRLLLTELIETMAAPQ